MFKAFQNAGIKERLNGGVPGVAIAVLLGTLAGLLVMISGIATVLGAIVAGVLFGALALLWQRVKTVEKRLSSRRTQEEDLLAFEKSVNARLEGFQRSLADEREGVEAVLAQGETRIGSVRGELSKFEQRLDEMAKDVGRLSDQVNPRGVPIPPEDASSAQVPPIAVVPQTPQAVNMKSAVANDGLSMHLQPIVDIAQRTPTLYEAFMRVRSARGQYLDQPQFQKMASQGGLMPTINKKVLFSSLRMLRRLGEKQMRAGVLCQIDGQSLSDTKGFQEIAALLKAYAHMNDLIVIEVTQRTLNALKDREAERLSLIADLGYALSLGQTQDVSFDPLALADRGFRYVRVPTTILLHADIDEGGGHTSRDRLSSEFANASLTLIANEVEREQDVLRLIDLNVTYGQGALFAPPRPVKSDLLTSPSYEAADTAAASAAR